jgi:hypothetical protein
MGDRKIIGSLFCLRRNRARNRMAIRMEIRTRVDSPLHRMSSNALIALMTAKGTVGASACVDSKEVCSCLEKLFRVQSLAYSMHYGSI